MFQFPRFGAQ